MVKCFELTYKGSFKYLLSKEIVLSCGVNNLIIFVCVACVYLSNEHAKRQSFVDLMSRGQLSPYSCS